MLRARLQLNGLEYIGDFIESFEGERYKANNNFRQTCPGMYSIYFKFYVTSLNRVEIFKLHQIDFISELEDCNSSETERRIRLCKLAERVKKNDRRRKIKKQKQIK